MDVQSTVFIAHSNMGCCYSSLKSRRKSQSPDCDFYSCTGPISFEDLEKCTRELSLQHALEVARGSTSYITRRNKQMFQSKRDLQLRKGIKHKDVLNKPSFEGPSCISRKEAPTTQLGPPQLTIISEGPPPSSGAVKKQRKGPTAAKVQQPMAQMTPAAQQQVPTRAEKVLSLATGQKEGQPESTDKTVEERQLTSEDTEFIEASMQFNPSAIPQSEASISLGSLSPLSPRDAPRDDEQFTPPTPHMLQPQDTQHEVLERLICLEVRPSTVSLHEEALLEAQQLQATATEEHEAADKDFVYTELLKELKDLRMVYECQLLHHEAAAAHHSEAEKSIQEKLSGLQGSVRDLNDTICTQFASILEGITRQGNAIIHGIGGLAAVMEHTAPAPTTQNG